MRTVTISRDLDLTAERARELACEGDVMRTIMWPVFTLRDVAVDGVRGAPDRLGIRPGLSIETRLWLGGVVPGWRHTIRIVELGATRIATKEHGGVIRRWDHELEFEPVGDARCRYTDRVVIDAGRLTGPAAAFAVAFYRWRAHRWRTRVVPRAAELASPR